MSLAGRLGTLFNVRKGEGLLVWLLLAHSFFLGIVVVFLYTAASALFFTDFNVETLPYVFMVSAAVLPVAGYLYERYERRMPVAQFYLSALGMLLAMEILLAVGVSLSHAAWLSFALLVWFEVVSNVGGLEQAGMVGRMLNVQQSKRLYGLIDSGEVGAQMLGGFSVPLLVGWLGTENLLYVAVLGLAVCMGAVALIARRYPARLAAPVEEESGPAGGKTSLPAIFKNRYVLLMFALCVLFIFAFYFVDYAFFDRVAARYPTEDESARFFGLYFGVVQGVRFVFQTLFSGRLISRFGLRFGLSILPLTLLAALTALAVSGAVNGPGAEGFFWLVVGTALLSDVLVGSIDGPAFQILYQPLPVRQRVTAQVAVESIVNPIAGGVVGLVLAVVTASTAFGILPLVYTLFPITLAWLVLAYFVFRQYTVVLARALSERTLESAQLSLDDASSLAILRAKLNSTYPGEVLYALELLEKIEHTAVDEFLVNLLIHPDAEVRRAALRRIESRRIMATLPAVEIRVEVEEDPAVRAAALAAWCALGQGAVAARVAEYLDHPDARVRLGALVALLRNGGAQGGALAGARLAQLAESPDTTQRMFVAQVYREAGESLYDEPLLVLLLDAELSVCRAALGAAGATGNPKFFPFLVDLLANSETAQASADALVKVGAPVVPELAAAWGRIEAISPTNEGLLRIARVAGQIGGPEATAFLHEKMHYPERDVRTQVLHGLSRCGYFTTEEDEVTVLKHTVKREIAEAVWALAAQRDLVVADAPELKRVHAALYDEVGHVVRRVFFLLGFMHDVRTMNNAWESLQTRDDDKRAYALEIVETRVTQDVRELLMPLLETVPLEERLRRLEPHFPQVRLERPQRLREIVTRPKAWCGPWTKACALEAAARLRVSEVRGAALTAASAPAPIVRETAIWALARLAPAIYARQAASWRGDASPQVARVVAGLASDVEGDAIMLLTIEKVIFLKTVSLFAETQDDVLASVAAVLEEVRLKSGAVIIEKGDLGNCMYIIVEGRVRVHDGERTMNYLSSRSFFGELALLDPEPRLASVTAMEDTYLFRLDQDTFYELMTDRREVLQGMMHVLCQRLRQMAKLLSNQALPLPDGSGGIV